MPDTGQIRLRPIDEGDLDLLERLHEDPVEAGEHDFYGFRHPGRLRRLWFEEGFLSPTGGRLAIADAAGRFLGEVQWHEVFQGPASPCWNIGIALLSSERGRGVGTQAQVQLADYLFAHTRVNRIEASTDRDNLAEQRSLERAGFTREGILRGACFRAGEWRDMVMYAVLRSDRPTSG
ncbi:GNAT family N-acetyltransferase [Nocardioides insulae]|uniref:GNAT family N-acetyltransferase n=1 Tax=Nocardioides insulae TaxID=394734 RepID=UPI0003FBEBB7|nr:GNAT family protein [Nocardioides insulae]